MDISTATKREEAAHTLPVYPQLDFVPVSGDGSWLTDADGRRVLDMYGGHAVAALGYNHPALLDAVDKQIRTLPFQSNIVANPVRAKAAALLTAFAGEPFSHAFFVNSGAEANENALRIAFLQTGGKHVVAVEHGFHGRTAAASAVTWGAKEKWYGFPNAPFDVTFVKRNRCDAIASAFREDTAAVIVEPVQGVAGAKDLCPTYLKKLAERAKQVGALFIADEVQSGMGRSGLPFAISHSGVTPDIITAAKSLGGGVACGAVITTAEIAAQRRFGDLGTTFGGGPVAAAAMTAVVETINKEGLVANAAAREAQVRESCVVGPIESVQGKGLLLGLRCKGPARAVRDALLRKNILTGLSGDPNIVRLLPPLNLDPEDVAHLADALADIPDGTC
ncbi:MAG: aminotransferase class III-fold pyridoxal phosphate-dependent enzyme [Pseudomonadota bacterium]